MRQKRIKPLTDGKVLRLDEALELMRIDGHSLMLMHANRTKPGDPCGRAYYIVPGGYINAKDALKIIQRDDVRPNNDGLFPGCNQTWRMGG